MFFDTTVLDNSMQKKLPYFVKPGIFSKPKVWAESKLNGFWSVLEMQGSQ
jgi:hypothetical protein